MPPKPQPDPPEVALKPHRFVFQNQYSWISMVANQEEEVKQSDLKPKVRHCLGVFSVSITSPASMQGSVPQFASVVETTAAALYVSSVRLQLSCYSLFATTPVVFLWTLWSLNCTSSTDYFFLLLSKQPFSWACVWVSTIGPNADVFGGSAAEWVRRLSLWNVGFPVNVMSTGLGRMLLKV